MNYPLSSGGAKRKGETDKQMEIAKAGLLQWEEDHDRRAVCHNLHAPR